MEQVMISWIQSRRPVRQHTQQVVSGNRRSRKVGQRSARKGDRERIGWIANEGALARGQCLLRSHPPAKLKLVYLPTLRGGVEFVELRALRNIGQHLRNPIVLVNEWIGNGGKTLAERYRERV